MSSSALLVFLAFTAQTVFAQIGDGRLFGPAGCDERSTGALVSYDMQSGSFVYSAVHPNGVPDAIRLVNRTGRYMQVNLVRALGDYPGAWGEFSVSVDYLVGISGYYASDPANHADPYQPWMGVGEVATRAKDSSDVRFEDMRWQAAGYYYGLSVPPGSCVVVGGYAGAHRIRSFAVETQPAVYAINSVRIPYVDEIVPCTSSRSRWSAWRNDTGTRLAIGGAYIYAAGGPDHGEVNGACLRIYAPDGRTITHSICSDALPIHRRGFVPFSSAVYLNPGEYVGGIASHSCAPGGVWGWAAYLSMW